MTKLAMSVRRVIERAIRDIECGDTVGAVAALSELIAKPERAEGGDDFRVKVVPIVRTPLPELPPVAVRDDEVRAVPKSRQRIEDPVAIEAYRAAHPVCEAAGDDCWYALTYPDGRPKVEVHHIVKKSKGGAGGDDVPQNFLALCTAHHTGRVGWHPLTPPVWFSRFNDRLAVVAFAKVSYFIREKAWNPALVDVAA